MGKRIIILLTVLMVMTPLLLWAKNITIKKIGFKTSAVTFEHTKHMRKAKSKQGCKTCHHKKTVRDGCVKCHKGNKGMKQVHKTCINECHRPYKKGPRSCKECHK